MMKNIYITPTLRTVQIQQRATILAGSAIPYSEDGDADAKRASNFTNEDDSEETSW